MKNQFSDLEKAFQYFVPSLVGSVILLLFAIVIYQIYGAIGMITFIFVATAIGAGLFILIDSSRRRRKRHKAKPESYSDSQMTDAVMKRIYEAYNIKEEIEEEDGVCEDEDEEEYDDEFEYEDRTEKVEDTSTSVEYTYPNFGNDYKEESVISRIVKGLNSDMLWILGIAVLFIFRISARTTTNPVEENVSVLIMVGAASFLTGLSGLVILVKGEYWGKSGEIQTGNKAYLAGFIRVIIGAILGVFAVNGLR